MFLMQQGFAERETEAWEKIRFQCFYLHNTMYWSGPAKEITDIMYLPGIDPDPKERVNDLREKIMRKNKEMGLLG